MKSCPNKEINLKNCNCTYITCSRKGVCCECITYHRENNQLPACYFSPSAEKTYDRSVDNFIRTHNK
ncbi:MAG: DUF6485 family protein [Candidatus Omnitrophica bacterium]|nr:DUF6485 family protein [Candidatus Omnitrophota bacterium]MDD5352118.1 DUF6485 family protein [Candidatus Omnitrophota bacterium]MDD5549716.1 DUF6485 family protein [Candidatus Omnitrophota bacterium]